ncbi:YeiH family protein [Rhodomicrobium lacus]|uniref:YeiH family protein n=1 Tax=Rhodomicrobium lacus TaxID=2498452 RepID=UPI000F8C70FE|nr:YeiH family protein [Rhodomicrobium lacus]
MANTEIVFQDEGDLRKARRFHRLHRSLRHHAGQTIWPGLFLVGTITGASFALWEIPGVKTFSPLILAIVLGMAFHNLFGTPSRAREGVQFSMRKLLRMGIVLLGLQLTVGQVAAVGGAGVAIIAASLVATFVFTKWLGRMLGVEQKLAELIAAGTSICGASAVIATNTVTNAHDEDVAYAVACVTLFGSIAMFVYPMLPAMLGLGPQSYGLWAGASIHEIAQVVAATFQAGQQAGEYGTIAKLSRVMMLAPLVLTLGFIVPRRASAGEDGARASVPMPWFVLGFVALTLFSSVVDIPAEVRGGFGTLTMVLLTMALGAMGLETSFRKLAAKGLRPLALAACASVFIAAFSLALVLSLPA